MTHAGTASLTINELREFASFTASEQRYIRRSLDIGLGRQDAFKRWARDETELASIRRQHVAYQDLKALRAMRPDDYNFDDVDAFMGKLVRMAAFDLAQERLTSFSAFRFLYERLLGGWSRPWLPGAFCGAAALPQIRPDRRRTLLHSISEAAATAPGWSDREPSFYPEFIEKEAA
ncbi:hypothetical protein [Novosphingobium guangzhouense]|uniref:Uncharacterized protein n=1 Tax=Novosphingobium guangzhouense TaxID=1850347 RepID=A0A2K2FSN8_9SPHN|nr:hypothetical protein [Novosphingobium guangzhouense]PNU01792.1 hypothetical protein A8V01_12095 [Novosphingobium guangzhouense]